MNDARFAARGGRRMLLVYCGALLACSTTVADPDAAPSAVPGAARRLLITNARVVDGTGSPELLAAVRVRDGRVIAIGALQPETGEAVLDAHGLVLAPGFIDTHSHAAGDLASHPDALGAVSQGITTIVAGQDGGSPGDPNSSFADAMAEIAKLRPALNVAAYVGHNSVRERVLGEDFRRPATTAEVARMAALVEEGMRNGALGFSTGLEYDPGIFSAPDEVLALARVAARYGGRYISHVRSEDRNFWPALDELISIGRETKMPVQVSHIKLAMRGLQGQTERLLATLDRARAEGIDVTADIYPYTYWHSTLTVIFPERDFDNRKAAEFALDEVAPADGLLLSAFLPEPSYVGKTVADIAQLRGTDPPATLMALIAEALAYEKAHPEAGTVEAVIGTSMTEADIARLFAWPYTNVCTDGSLDGRHPRGFGSFPRVLGRMVRDQKIVSLPEAIRKMTSLAAHNMGFTDRGTIAPGMAADLVLFDPATVLDHATTEAPWAVSVGIERVWVNGVEVYANGKTTGERPGQVVRRLQD